MADCSLETPDVARDQSVSGETLRECAAISNGDLQAFATVAGRLLENPAPARLKGWGTPLAATLSVATPSMTAARQLP